MAEKKLGFIWYSSASDISAQFLAKELNFDSGKKLPNLEPYEVLLCWGCRPGKFLQEEGRVAQLNNLVAQGSLRILNHPTLVEAARNKAQLYTRLQEAQIPVPGWLVVEMPKLEHKMAAVSKAITDGVLEFPIAGGSQYGSWAQPTLLFSMAEVKEFLVECNAQKKLGNVQMFRSFSYGEERRLHLFRGDVIYAEVKTSNKMTPASAKVGLLETLKKKLDTQLFNTHQVALAEACGILGTHHFATLDNGHKAARLGWTWIQSMVEAVSGNMAELARRVMDTLQLDVAAISFAHTTDNILDSVKIVNVTTGPGLVAPGTEADPAVAAQYTRLLRMFTSKQFKPTVAKRVAKANAIPLASMESVANIRKKLKYLSAEKAEAIAKILS